MIQDLVRQWGGLALLTAVLLTMVVRMFFPARRGERSSDDGFGGDYDFSGSHHGDPGGGGHDGGGH